MQQEPSQGATVTDEQLLGILCRVFQVSCGQRQRDGLYLPELAGAIQQEGDNKVYQSYDDLISQILVEVLLILQQCQDNPFVALVPAKSSGTSPSKGHSSSPFSSSPVKQQARQFPHEKFAPEKCKEVEMISYLLDCYDRVNTEERKAPKRSGVPPMKDALVSARSQCVSHTCLILQGVFTQPRSPAKPSLLLPYLLNQNLPVGFLSDLVSSVCVDKETFSQVFSPVLQGLAQTMRHLSLDTEDFRQPLLVLSELCELKHGNTRPLCNLIVEQSNWLPKAVTPAGGMEIERLSYLGPFFSLSVFAEDSVKVVDKYFSDVQISPENSRMMNKQLQHLIEFARGELFKVLHTLLLNGDTRDAALGYIAAVLDRNQKRAQMQADERMISGEGFMLNFLTVLQQLSVKIKLDKVRTNVIYVE